MFKRQKETIVEITQPDSEPGIALKALINLTYRWTDWFENSYILTFRDASISFRFIRCLKLSVNADIGTLTTKGCLKILSNKSSKLALKLVIFLVLPQFSYFYLKI